MLDSEASVDESDDAEVAERQSVLLDSDASGMSDDDCVIVKAVSAEEMNRVDLCGDDLGVVGVLSSGDPDLQALLQGVDFAIGCGRKSDALKVNCRSNVALGLGGSKVGVRCGAGAWSCAGVPDVELVGE